MKQCSFSFPDHCRQDICWCLEDKLVKSIPSRNEMPQYYYIVSQLNGMVLDVRRGNKCPGANIIMFPKHGRDNQQWYDHECTGTIRSKMNDFCLDVQSGKIVLNPYQDCNCRQKWKRCGSIIVNSTYNNAVLDICGNNNAAEAEVIQYPLHGGANQCWRFEYVCGCWLLSRVHTREALKLYSACDQFLYYFRPTSDASVEITRRTLCYLCAN